MFTKREIEAKLAQIRSQFEGLQSSRNGTIQTTTVDPLGLKSRSSWDNCVKTTISQLSMGVVNKGVYIEVDVCTKPAMLTGLMTCVQDDTGFVELSVYNWLPRKFVKTEHDLDWAFPKDARIRIREPYLKQSEVNFMTMMSGARPNVFIRVDSPSDIQFCSIPPNFSKKFSHLVDPLLKPNIVSTPPSATTRSSANFIENVEMGTSLTGQGLFTKNPVKKDGLVFVEKALVSAEGNFGMMLQSNNSAGDINT